MDEQQSAFVRKAKLEGIVPELFSQLLDGLILSKEDLAEIRRAYRDAEARSRGEERLKKWNDILPLVQAGKVWTRRRRTIHRVHSAEPACDTDDWHLMGYPDVRLVYSCRAVSGKFEDREFKSFLRNSGENPTHLLRGQRTRICPACMGKNSPDPIGDYQPQPGDVIFVKFDNSEYRVTLDPDSQNRVIFNRINCDEEDEGGEDKEL